MFLWERNRPYKRRPTTPLKVRKMKILVCHNRYRSDAPSGENRYVDEEIALLRGAGMEVVSMIEESDSVINGSSLQKANAALGSLYSPTGVRRFRRILREERPDVVHLHHLFPLISPPVIRVAKAAGVPTVQRVHNHRHTCVGGLHFRDGRQCDDCVGLRIAYPAIMHGCFRESRPQSAVKVLSETMHRKTWRMMDRFLVFTPFAARRLLTAGIEERQITVLPPWIQDPGEPIKPGEDFLFLGLLRENKGINLLLDAWRSRTRRDKRRLRIAGTGPLEDQVRSMALKEDDVDYLGHLDHNEAAAQIQRCGVVVVPSLGYEGFPLSVVEALAHGRPVMVNSSTSFASALSNEFAWCIQPTVNSWRNSIDAIKQEDVQARGLAARKYYVKNCSPSAAIKSLVEIYDDVLTRFP